MVNDMADQEKTGAQQHQNGNKSSNEHPSTKQEVNSPLAEKKDSHSNDSDSREYNAPPSSFSIPMQNGTGDRGAGNLADFFRYRKPDRSPYSQSN